MCKCYLDNIFIRGEKKRLSISICIIIFAIYQEIYRYAKLLCYLIRTLIGI